MAVKLKVQLSRQKVEFYYSLFLIILIPAILAFNTLWLSQRMKRDLDVELQRKANLANEIFGSAIVENLEEPDKIQTIIRRVSQNSDEIKALSLSIPTDDNTFEVIASTKVGEIGSASQNLQETVAWTRKRSIATLLTSGSGSSTQRVWQVTTPVNNEKSQQVALLNMSVSSSDVDQLIASSYRQSLIIMFASVVAIILLMVNHFRFVGYAMLLKKLEEVDQMKNDFLSVATHELKTPMAVIKGYISMVLDGSGGKVDKKGRANLSKVFEQTERLNRLVTDLLDVSRLEQGRTKYDLQPLHLPDIISPIIEDLQKRAADKDLKLAYEPTADLPEVKLDPDRAKEVFINLIDNAIKYTEQGTVTVLHTVTSGHLTTQIKDTGIGMSAKDREKLFQRFYRIKNDKTENISGTGLGLWIIKQYIEHMNGTIEVDSMEGVGSKFTVAFPASKTKPS